MWGNVNGFSVIIAFIYQEGESMFIKVITASINKVGDMNCLSVIIASVYKEG